MSLVRIGVDVGGTHTDSFLAEGNKMISHFKTETTTDITTGVIKAISELFAKSSYPKEKVQSVNIGTTHLVNAFIQGEGINRVMTLRLAGGATTALPPGCDWPEKIRHEIIGEEGYIIDGGYEYDGKEIASINPKQVLWAINRAIDQKITAVAVIGVFANVRPEQELLIKQMFKQKAPAITVIMSHTVGKLGLIPRENLTILNAASIQLFDKISQAFQKALNSLQLPANLYLTFGDGTKSILNEVGISPLKTFHSGPANSITGAAILAQVKNAVIGDIGGTSSDFSLFVNGCAVQENSSFPMTGIGVMCNFDLPRINSFGLGGGSIIEIKNDEILIGPKSLGHKIYQKALCFGGDIITPTDIAVCLERFYLGTISKERIRQKIAGLFPHKNAEALIREIDDQLHQKLVKGIKEMLGSIEEIPPTLVLVGGGALLFDIKKLKKLLPHQIQSVVIPPSSEVANALGAANSLIGAKFIKVYDYAKITRKEAIFEATEKAKQIAVSKGAHLETVKTTHVHEVQINYLTGEPHETTISVVGEEKPFQPNLQLKFPEEKEIEPSLPLFPTDEVEPLLSASKKMITTAGIQNIPIGRELSPQSVHDIAWGAGLLGSGGGGSPSLGLQLALNSLILGQKISLIDLEDLPDDFLTVGFGVVGSPVVLDERPPSIREGIESIREIERKLGRKVNALVVLEAGGMNCTYPLFVAAALGLPIVDGDMMGRAFPGINMITPNIYGKFQKLQAAQSNGRQTAFIEASTFSSLEEQARKKTVELGGITSTALVTMTGLEAKKLVIKGSLSTAEKMGRALRESQGETLQKRLQALNNVLKDTDYKKAELLFQGTIVKLASSASIMAGFNIGGFLIEDASNKKLWIGYQNENLIAVQPSTNEIIVQVPDLITIIDPNNIQPISCGEYRYGQTVAVLKLTAPKMMSSQEALAVVGPSAFPIKEIMSLGGDYFAGK